MREREIESFISRDLFLAGTCICEREKERASLVVLYYLLKHVCGKEKVSLVVLYYLLEYALV